ncbi:membrane protein insertase YidC [Solicola sp. PLA-1-18]|uniref:membrane protein insertase YidC n=1 Tax=Solicola sp. PLA-1-18 TaxID=3380532 RepID=UPI003B815E6C
MSPFDLPPVAALLRHAGDLVLSLADALAPLVGADHAAAAAVVTLTALVRLLLVPLGVAQVRADLGRRRIAPLVADLRRRYRDRPEVLRARLLELYDREGASPLAGCLPVLAQAPVLAMVYGVFTQARLAGLPNLLLDQALVGVGLGSSLVRVVAAGALTPPGATVFAALLLVVAVAGVVLARSTAPVEGVEPVPGAGGLRYLAPVLSVGFACFVPLAAALYLATSAAWTCTERLVVRRVLLARG